MHMVSNVWGCKRVKCGKVQTITDNYGIFYLKKRRQFLLI